MDDQQMDQWFADKLKKEQEFDYRESDWETISDRMDRQEESGKRRRLVWLWWPIGIAATLVAGLFFWQQQQQIIDLRNQLSKLQSSDTVRKTIIIQDTIRKTITLPEKETNSLNAQQNTELQGIANTNPQPTHKHDSSDAESKDTSKKSINENTILEKNPHDISNSSVVKGRPQLSAVDSSTELPTFFSADGAREKADSGRRTVDGGRETPARLTEAGRTANGRRLPDLQRKSNLKTGKRAEKFLVLTNLPIPEPEVIRTDNNTPDISPLSYQNATTNKATPTRKWKPVFELDAALGLGQPDINVSNLFDQGQALSYNFGAGLSMQTFKRLWVRFGVSHQTLRYKFQCARCSLCLCL